MNLCSLNLKDYIFVSLYCISQFKYIFLTSFKIFCLLLLNIIQSNYFVFMIFILIESVVLVK